MYKTLEKPSQSPRYCCQIAYLSSHQSKTQQYSVSSEIKQRKAAHPDISEAWNEQSFGVVPSLMAKAIIQLLKLLLSCWLSQWLIISALILMKSLLVDETHHDFESIDTESAHIVCLLRTVQENLPIASCLCPEDRPVL